MLCGYLGITMLTSYLPFFVIPLVVIDQIPVLEFLFMHYGDNYNAYCCTEPTV